MNVCNKCEQGAAFDSPENLCDEHWVDWWLEGYDKVMSPQKLQEERQQIMEIISKDHD